MTEDRVNVLITGVGGGSVGMQILKSLRLSEIPYHICGTDMSKQSMGLPKADKGYVVPPAIHNEYISTILEICKNEEIQVLFPGSEPELKVLSENREIFEERSIYLAINSPEIINFCMDKKETFRILNNLGIPIPKTKAIDSREDIDDIDFLPVIIKPYIGSGGSNNTFIAQDRDELIFFCEYILKYGRKPLVQQYIGSYDNEYTVGVLSRRDGNIISVVALKRFILTALSNRLKIPSLHNKKEILAISSGISQGEIVNDKVLLDQCREIALKIDSKGPINIQCRYVNDKVYPFEINPRFSGTTHMRTLAGVNEPDLFIRMNVLNEDIKDNIVAKTGVAIRGLEEMFIR